MDNPHANATWDFIKEKKIATGTFATVWMSTLPKQGDQPSRVVAVKKQK